MINNVGVYHLFSCTDVLSLKNIWMFKRASYDTPVGEGTFYLWHTKNFCSNLFLGGGGNLEKEAVTVHP